jgi:RNA exonuclease 4
MAPIDLGTLSSNWKILQQRLRPSTPAAAPKQEKIEEEQQTSLKRKRSQHVNGKLGDDSTKSVNGSEKSTPRKPPPARKRQKMEEPASVGASAKRHDTKNLKKSISMPALKKTPLLSGRLNPRPTPRLPRYRERRRIRSSAARQIRRIGL